MGTNCQEGPQGEKLPMNSAYLGHAGNIGVHFEWYLLLYYVSIWTERKRHILCLLLSFISVIWLVLELGFEIRVFDEVK